VNKPGKFWKILFCCAGGFLALVAIGLVIFWNFIGAFEVSRPQTTIATYMQDMTGSKLALLDEATMTALDRNLQNEEEFLKAVDGALEKITYAKNTKLTNDSQQVYMLLSGGKSLGSVTMTVTHRDHFGFDHWAVTQTDVDISFLLGEGVSVTVPADYQVYVGGTLLDSTYITDNRAPYTGVQEYYADFQLPFLNTYTTGRIFGTPQLTVTDGKGNAVNPEDLEKVTSIPDNCPEENRKELSTFVDRFMNRYVRYTMATGGRGMLYINYNGVTNYVKDDSKLHVRLKDALDGLGWVQDRRAKITDIVIHAMVDMGNNHYLCDFTYVVDSKDGTGTVRSETNVRLLIERTEYGLRATVMTNY